MMMVISCVLDGSAQEVIGLPGEKGVMSDSLIVEPPGVASVAEPLDVSLPPLTSWGTLAHYPYYGSAFFTPFANWSLHSGVNASISASAIIGLGHNAGSGFANSLALMYANKITPKLSFAIGGYAAFLQYGGRQMRDAGMTAMLNYRFDDHWEAAVFGQKSILQPRIPPQLYWMNDVGDKIGASLRYNFSPSFSVSVSVWEERTQGRQLPPLY